MMMASNLQAMQEAVTVLTVSQSLTPEPSPVPAVEVEAMPEAVTVEILPESAGDQPEAEPVQAWATSRKRGREKGSGQSRR